LLQAHKIKSLWIPAESTGTKEGIFIDLNDKETINQFKTADYEGKEVIGQDIADELKLVEFVDGKSSTQTIEKIQKGN